MNKSKWELLLYLVVLTISVVMIVNDPKSWYFHLSATLGFAIGGLGGGRLGVQVGMVRGAFAMLTNPLPKPITFKYVNDWKKHPKETLQCWLFGVRADVVYTPRQDAIAKSGDSSSDNPLIFVIIEREKAITKAKTDIRAFYDFAREEIEKAPQDLDPFLDHLNTTLSSPSFFFNREVWRQRQDLRQALEGKNKSKGKIWDSKGHLTQRPPPSPIIPQ